jgi:hypothetical protein
MHEREDHLPLRGEAATLLAIFGGDDVWCVHAEQGIRSRCLFASHAK